MLTFRCDCGNGLHVDRNPDAPFVLSACRDCLVPIIVRFDGTAGDLDHATIEALHPPQVPPESLMAHVLPCIGESIQNLPVLPEVAQRVIATIHDPLGDIREVARLLGEDAVLGARVLQLANSAAYGGMRVPTLPDACVRLGMKRILHVVHMLAQVDVYRTLGSRYRDFLSRLWRHSIATAHCIEAIACRAHLRLEHTPFLAGLFHDIGKLVLADTILNRYHGPIGQLEHNPELMLEALRDYFCLAGLHAVQKWGLPSAVCVAVYFHTQPDRPPLGDGQRLAMAVQLADAMATLAGFSVADGDHVDLENLVALRCFELSPGPLRDYCSELPEVLEPVLETFALG